MGPRRRGSRPQTNSLAQVDATTSVVLPEWVDMASNLEGCALPFGKFQFLSRCRGWLPLVQFQFLFVQFLSRRRRQLLLVQFLFVQFQFLLWGRGRQLLAWFVVWLPFFLPGLQPDLWPSPQPVPWRGSAVAAGLLPRLRLYFLQIFT
ncbi:hypothetical protein EXN66_Car002690 [Channa argus]|uniref:Uncharacterized protein n=1 Tax=Channa argus TaxID=215402 RepID=A0A6G1PAF8_CHAAH|nr:hypothetical protein EXN66_Car002690 [Channa argus]